LDAVMLWILAMELDAVNAFAVIGVSGAVKRLENLSNGYDATVMVAVASGEWVAAKSELYAAMVSDWEMVPLLIAARVN
jgi:hypothetical protein